MGLAGGGGGGGGARGVSFAEWSLFVRRVRVIMPVCECLEQAVLQHRERRPYCVWVASQFHPVGTHPALSAGSQLVMVNTLWTTY